MEAASGDQRTVLVGRVSDLGPKYVVLGVTRIELDEEQGSAAFAVGHSAIVMAFTVDGKLVGGKIVSPVIAQPTK
jgi:hypothetical protein